jgi:uncharacterized phage protein (TIGR02218 family)
MRNIPIAMVPNLEDAAPRWCFILKVIPVVGESDSDGLPQIGITTWDQNISYDDGTGLTVYYARRGYDSYANQMTADLAVDNSEARFLISEDYLDGITQDQIRRGDYDDAKFIQYMVNPDDLSQSHVIITSGSVGRVTNVDGLDGTLELRSLTQILKQKSIIEMGSNNCRVVKFGDERCKYPVDTLWDNGEVDDVGLETDREFTIIGSDISDEDDYYHPGLVEFITGNNAGRSYEVESYEASSSGNTIVLAIPTELPIQSGDEFQIRPDCTRLWEGHNSCETYDNRLNYRGEPWRPVSDTSNLMVSGAGSNNTGQNTPPAAEA